MTITFLTKELDRFLNPIGFKRVRTTWNRENGRYVDVLNIERIQALSAVTLNVGVMERDIFLDCWGREADRFVDEPYCIVRARIGKLIDGKGRYWKETDSNTVNEIISCIQNYAIPLFVKANSLKGMSDWLVSVGAPSHKNPLETAYFAVLQHRLGDQVSACHVLANMAAKALGDWKAKAKEISNRIGCN